MEWREYLLTLQGHTAKRLESWKQTRQICYTVYQMNADPKRLLTIERFWPMGEKVEKGGINQDLLAAGKRLKEKLKAIEEKKKGEGNEQANPEPGAGNPILEEWYRKKQKREAIEEKMKKRKEQETQNSEQLKK